MAGAANAAEIFVSSDITVSETWTANNTYNLTTQIYVKNGATLTIEPGTVVASTPTVNGSGSLAVTKGSQIFACGTADDPIIMTSTADVATWVGGDHTKGVYRDGICSEWGNLTIMGCAYMNDCKILANLPTCDAGNQGQMEGLAANADGLYGGGDDEDDSGKLEYVSLRYGGRVVGLTNELNGLSLGAIGRETDISNIDIISNVDDGIEIWGGTVNLKYLSLWNVGDDSLDIDQGYRGKIQFVFIVQGFSCRAAQGSGVGDNCIEIDGSETSERQPVTTTTIYNATVVGQRLSGDHATAWRDNANVQYRNCIIMDIGDDLVKSEADGDPCGTGYGFMGTLTFAQRWATLASVTSPVNACANPALIYTAQDPTGFLCEIRDSCFFNIADIVEATAVGVFGSLGNSTVGSLPIQSITRGPDEVILGLTQQPVISIDPRPSGSVAATSAPNDGFYCDAPYKGAFAPNVSTNWACWTAASDYDYLVVPAATLVRNGGANPNVLTGSTLTLCDPFTLTVTPAPYLFANPFGFDTPFSFTLAGGQTLLCLDLGGNGELLALPFMAGPVAVYNGVVPNVTSLCGFQFCAQSILFGGTVPFALSNALDITIGN